MGNWNYTHPSEIIAEMASLTPLYAGASFDRLENYNTLQWRVHPDGTDEPILYLNVQLSAPVSRTEQCVLG
jgi:formate dehydrogenase major subunit